jgi:hypothetical protein
LNCVLIASALASETAAPWRWGSLDVRELSIPGKDTMSVCVFRARAELDLLLWTTPGMRADA